MRPGRSFLWWHSATAAPYLLFGRVFIHDDQRTVYASHA
jgi:hypothetical protein